MVEVIDREEVTVVGDFPVSSTGESETCWIYLIMAQIEEATPYVNNCLCLANLHTPFISAICPSMPLRVT